MDNDAALVVLTALEERVIAALQEKRYRDAVDAAIAIHLAFKGIRFSIRTG